EVGVRKSGDLLDAFGFVFVDVHFRLDALEHLGRTLDALSHHPAAKMVRVIMRDENLVDLVAFLLHEIANRSYIPRRIDHRGLARRRIADDVDVVRHRAELRLAQIEPLFACHRGLPPVQDFAPRRAANCRAAALRRAALISASSRRSPRSHRNSGSPSRFATHLDWTNRWSLRRLT